MPLDDTTTTLLDMLHRGGTFGYWWTSENKQSTWWMVDAREPLPSDKHNIYFGVHPTTTIPETNPRGEPAESRYVRAQLGVIAAVNCLYTEFDAKDFGGDKSAAKSKAESLVPPPSVMIDSGGGYHLYWLFEEPWILKGEKSRAHAKKLQAAWVAYAGGDAAAKDLARVLRVPGTHNYKYKPAPVVTVVLADFDRLYSPAELAAHCRDELDALDVPASGGQNGLSTTNGTSHYAATGDARVDRYVRAALDGEVGEVLRAPAGMKHDVIRNSAVKLGTLVARGLLDEQQAFRELANAASLHRNDVRDTERTILDGLAYGKQHPRDIPEPHYTASIPTRFVADSDQPVEEQAKTLPTLLRADALHQIPPAEAIIANLLYINTLHQWFGAPGSGKSYLALDVAATLAALGKRVIYVAAEAIEDYEARLDAWQSHHKQQATELYFWCQPLILANPKDVQTFLAAIHDLKPELIVFDPLADCMTGLDESSAKDMSIATHALHTIRRATRAALLVLHHTGWSTDHERGHSILRGTCRVVVRIEAREDGLIRMTCEKKNHGRKFDPRSFRLVEAGTKGNVTPLPAYMVMAGRLRLTENLLRILEALTTEPLRNGATHTDLKNDTNMTAGTLNRALTALSEAGYIYAEEKNRSQKYKLSRQGRDVLDLALEEQNGSWKNSGRTLEESGRAWNWQIASSTVLGDTDAVLPNSSNSLPPPSEYIYPTDIYSEVDLDGKNSSTSFRDISWFDAEDASADDDPLFPEPNLEPTAPDAPGLIGRLRARQEGETA